MDRASSEVLSVAQEAARLRKDRLSSSKDAQDCRDTVGSADPGLRGQNSPSPGQAPSRRELTLQLRQSFSEGQRLSQPHRHPESSHQEQGWEQPLGPCMALQPPREQEKRALVHARST